MLCILGNCWIIWILRYGSIFFDYLDVYFGMFFRNIGLFEFICDKEVFVLKWICLYCFMEFGLFVLEVVFVLFLVLDFFFGDVKEVFWLLFGLFVLEVIFVFLDWFFFFFRDL